MIPPREVPEIKPMTEVELAQMRWHVATFPDGKTDFGSHDVARLLATLDVTRVQVFTALGELRKLSHPTGGCASGCGFCAGDLILGAARAALEKVTVPR